MNNSEKLSLFRNGFSESVGLTDVSSKQFNNWEMILINDGYDNIPNKSVCTTACDGTIVAPCACMRVIPHKSVCTTACDGTIVAPCACMRVMPAKSTCTTVCDNTIVGRCGGCGVIIPLK